MQKLQYHGWPVSAFVKDKSTGKVGQIESPYTAQGEKIVAAGRVLVSGLSLYGVDPNSIEAA
jgi:hypothetical protein